MANFFDDFNGINDEDYESRDDELLASVMTIEGYSSALPGLAEEKTLQQVLSAISRGVAIQQDQLDMMRSNFEAQMDDLHQDNLAEESRHDYMVSFLEKWFGRNYDATIASQQRMSDQWADYHESTSGLLNSLLSNVKDLALADYLRSQTGTAENMFQDTYNNMVELRKALGWTNDQYAEINNQGLEVVRQLNSQYGSIFDNTDMQDALLSMANAGVKDPQLMMEMLDTVMKMNMAMPGAESANLRWMSVYGSRYGSDAVTEIIDAATELTQKYGVNADEVFSELNSGEIADLILKNEESAEDAIASAESLMSTVAAIQTNTNMDPDEIMSLMSDIMEVKYTDSNYAELERMLASIGISGGVQGAKATLEEGDFSGFAEQLLSGINGYIEREGEVAVNVLKSMGFSDDMLLGTEVYYDQIMTNMDNIHTDLNDGMSALDSTLENYPMGVVDKFFNELSTNQWFNDVVTLLGSLNVSIADIYFLLAVLKTGGQLIGGLGRGIGRLFGLGGSAAGGAAGSAGTAAATGLLGMTYDAAHGGIYQATSNSFLARIIGSTGNTMFRGSGLLGVASNTGMALQGAGLAGQATTTGLGTAASGVAGVAGGLVGAASIIDGVVDIVNAQSAATWQEQNDKVTEGVVQLGAVASGAGLGAALGSVVPGIGTLVGAGVGGMIGLIFGDDAAEVITDYLDGTKEIQDALDSLTTSAEDLNTTWEKRENVETLIDRYYELNGLLEDTNVSSEDRNQYEEELYSVLTDLNQLYPNLIDANTDNVGAIEDGIEAIDKMTEAELILAQTRAKNAIKQGVEAEEDLASQLEKSQQTQEDAMANIEAYNTLSERTSEIEKLVRSGDLVFTGNYAGTGIDTSKSTKEAQDVWNAFMEDAYDMWTDTGLNVVWGDGVNSVGYTDTKNAIQVYKNMTGTYAADKMEGQLSDAEAAMADTQQKQQNYDDAFAGIVDNIEAGLGMTLQEAKSGFYTKLDDDQRNYLASTISDMNLGVWDHLTGDNRSDRSALVALKSYVANWERSHSHYFGLENVPFDDYIANLHSGEMVLPAEASTALRTIMGVVGATTMPQLTTVLMGLSTALTAKQRDEEYGTDKAGADFNIRAQDYAEQVLKARAMSAEYLDQWSPNTPVIDDFMKYFDSIYDQISYEVIEQQVSDGTAQSSGIITSSGRQAIVDAAKGAVGKEYIWGGEMYDTDMKGADCSGLVYYAYNEAGYGSDIGGRLTASGYYARGTNISKDELQPGDVVYTNFTGTKPGHIGIYIGPDHVIDAGNKKAGIRDTTLGWWTAYQRLLDDSVLGAVAPTSVATTTTSDSTSDEGSLFNYFMATIKNPYGVAGIMGNLEAESGLRPNNLQNSYEKSLGMNDVQYTSAVDNGTYNNFVHDSAGYGLAQWTYWSRKKNLYDALKGANESIASLDGQAQFLIKELAGYGGVTEALQGATSVKEASDVFLTQYERPADQSANAKTNRAKKGQVYYDRYLAGTYGTQSFVPEDTSVEQTASEAKQTSLQVNVANSDVVAELRRTTMRLEAKLDQLSGKGGTPRVSTRASVNPTMYG